MDDKKLCGKPATQVVLWPTLKEIDCCEAHAKWAKKVAEAMSSPIRLTPIEADGNRTCTQKVSS